MLGQKGKWKKDVNSKFDSTYTGQRGVNTQGQYGGFYVDGGSGQQVGTLIDGGKTTTVVYPDPTQVYTVLEGINDAGLTAGQWEDSGGIVHSFSWDSVKDKFTEIDDPAAASFTQAWGVNSKGLIAVSSDAGSYIYCTLKASKCPSTGMPAKRIEVRETTLSPGALRRLVEANSRCHHNPVRLPKGAAIQ